MKYLKIIAVASLFAILILPASSIAMDTNQMPDMNRGYGPTPAMMGNPNMDPQIMMQRQQMMQRMMQMRQQNMPMHGPAAMNSNPSCNHSPMGKHSPKGNKNSTQKAKKQQLKITHMKNMEQRLANIEALLKELVELQKK
jgi:hypothetical protein